jgi:hypothetical protein
VSLPLRLAATLLLASACLQPVDVGSNDAGHDGGALPCTVGRDETCNELGAMSALAGACTPSGCACLSGFELGPTGRCRPQGVCPQSPQQPGQPCTAVGLTCRYGYQPLECGGRTVRCEGTTWVEVEHSDPQTVCGGQALSWQPVSLDFGSVPPGQAATLEVTFFNPNLRSVQLSGLTAQAGGAASSVFRVVAAAPGDVTRLAVPAGQRDGGTGPIVPGSAKVTVQFQPMATGTQLATLVASTDLSSQPMLSVPLSGRGATPSDGGTPGCYALCGFADTCSSAVQAPRVGGQCPPRFADATSCTVSACLPPPVCAAGQPSSCNDTPGVTVAMGRCTPAGQCLCGAGAELNPATGRCRPSPLDGGAPLCTGTGLDQACNEVLVMSSFAGECAGGRCFCAQGFEPSPAGRCQPPGSVCTDRVAMSCNDGPVDGGIGGLAGTCVLGQCVCNPGFSRSPATGRCAAARTPTPCTVGQDETCNADPAMSALAGQCQAGTCTCAAGFALTSDGRCAASSTGLCVVTTAPGMCSLTTLDGGATTGTGTCGARPLSAGCTCSAGSSPGMGLVFCAGACPMTPGVSCVSTNCGLVNCLPPTRCITDNQCAVP